MPSLFENNQQFLISSLKSGDRKIFAQIYEDQSKSIYIKLLKLVRSEKIAEELLQELFVKLWIKKDTLEIHTNLPAYLNRMAANLAYDYFRKAAREQKARAALLEHFDVCYDPSHTQAHEYSLLQELDTLIGQLPPQRKKVLELCKIQGKSYQEAGNLLGISASTVNDHIVKATKILRAQLLEKKSLNALLILLFYCSN